MPLPVPERVGEALRRSTVAVRSGKADMGSGVAVHSDLVITNAHVVSEAVQRKRLDQG